MYSALLLLKKMTYLSLIFFRTLIIFDYVIFVNCLLFLGGYGHHSFLIKDILYYDYVEYFASNSGFFYINLTNVSLDNDTIDPSDWIDISDITPRPDGDLYNPFLAGKAYDEIFFVGLSVVINIFDTTLKKWDINKSFKGKPRTSYISSF